MNWRKAKKLWCKSVDRSRYIAGMRNTLRTYPPKAGHILSKRWHWLHAGSYRKGTDQ